MSAELLAFRTELTEDATPAVDEAEDFLDLPPIMSPGTLAKILEVTPQTLARWRDPKQAGEGPRFIKVPGSQLIRYLRADVVAWLKECAEAAA